MFAKVLHGVRLLFSTPAFFYSPMWVKKYIIEFSVIMVLESSTDFDRLLITSLNFAALNVARKKQCHAFGNVMTMVVT